MDLYSLDICLNFILDIEKNDFQGLQLTTPNANLQMVSCESLLMLASYHWPSQ